MLMAGGQEGFTKEGQLQLEVLESRGGGHSRPVCAKAGAWETLGHSRA